MSITISGQVNARTAAADEPVVRATMRTVFGPVPYRLDNALWSDPLGLTAPGKGPASGPAAPASGRTVRLVEAAALGRIKANTVLVNGAWPGTPDPGGPVPAALPAAVSGYLHAGPGTVLALRDRDTGRPVRLLITGLFRPRNLRAPYWGLDTLGASGVTVQPPFTTYGPLVVSSSAFGRGGLAVGQVSWVAVPEAARIGVGVAGLAARISHAESFLSGTTSLGGLQVSTGMPQVLTSTGLNLAVARSLLTIGALQFLLLAAAALVLPARLLANHRDEESALLSARGARRWQLISPGLAEAVLLGGTAAVAGALAGSRLADLLVDTPALRAAGLRLTGMPAAVWWAALVVLTLCLAIMLGPALRPAVPGEARARRGRQAAIAAIARAGGDIALLALALVAILELRTYSAVAHTAAGGIGIDPVPAAAPALALAAVTLITLRILPVLARAVDRITTGTRRLGAALASWEISRRPVSQSGPVLLVILAVATGTVALTQRASWRQSAHDQATFAVGADVHVSTARAAQLATAAAVARAPGVSAATPVTRFSLGSGGEVLAVDGRAAAATVSLRRDLSPLPPAALWGRITPRWAAGIPLPGRPARLAITASLDSGKGAASLGRAPITATIQDADGIEYAVPAGLLPADGKTHRLVAGLSSGRQAVYPLRLLGVSLSYQLPLFAGQRYAQPAAGLTINSLTTAASAAGPFAPPFAAGTALRAWTPSVSSPELTGLAAQGFAGTGPGALGAQPSVAGWAPAPGRAVSLSFLPGKSPDLVALRLDAATLADVVGMMSVTAPVPVTAIPGIATASFLHSSHAHVGMTAPVALAGASVPVKIVAAVTDFPTITGPGGALIVDQTALGRVLASKKAEPPPVTEWWLRTATGRAPPGLPPGSAVDTRAHATTALLTNPLSVAPQQAALAIAIASTLLAVVGFSVSVAASLRARRVQRAVLSALGVSRAGLASQLCLEQLMLSLPAACTGLLAGVLIAHLVVPADTLTTAATLPVPPVLVEIPLGWAAVLALAVAAIPVAAAAATVALRPDPAPQLRNAESV
jgi:hypothetical protein